MASSKKTIRNMNSAGQRPGRLNHVLLVQWITRSDEAALAQFHSVTSELLFGLLLYALRDPTTADEVLSKVYAEVRREGARFDQRDTCLLVWLITIAHWHAYEHLRPGKTYEPLAGLNDCGERRPKVEQNFGLNRSQHQRMVAATLASLSPAQIQMIELAYFSRLAPVEIALRLGQRLETVKGGLQDGMSKLCRLFKGDFPANVIKKRLPRVA